MCGGRLRDNDRSRNEIGEQPIAGGGVVAAVVYIDGFTGRVEEMDGVQGTRFERLLEKRISIRGALLEGRTVVEGDRLLGGSKSASRVVLIRLKYVHVRDVSRRKQLLHQHRSVAPIRCDVLVEGR